MEVEALGKIMEEGSMGVSIVRRVVKISSDAKVEFSLMQCWSEFGKSIWWF